MATKKVFVGIGLFLAIFVLSALARAADGDDDQGLNVQLFRPSIFGGPFVSLDESRPLGALSFHAGALFNYTHSLLTDYQHDDPGFEYLADLFTGDLLLSFAPLDWLGLGVDVPLHYTNHRPVEDVYHPLAEPELKDKDLEWNFEVGDIRAALKFGVLEQDRHWLGLALIPFVDFPTGKTESYLGEGRITGGGKLALGHDFGAFNLGLEGGYLYRGENDVLLESVGDAYQWGAGIARDFDDGFGFSLEYTGRYYAVDDRETFHNNPMEVLATLRYRFGQSGPRLLVGGGPGASQGVGAPVYRILGGVDYTYQHRTSATEPVSEK